MKIPEKATVLGFTKNQSAAIKTASELARVGIAPAIWWNVPQAWTQFIHSRLASPGAAMRHKPAFFNISFGHYSILSIAKDLGETSVMVVEDDCRFLKDAGLVRQTLESAPADADLLLLDSFSPKGGAKQFNGERKKAVAGWARISAARSAAAYIAGPKAVARLLFLSEMGTRGGSVRIFDQWFDKRWLNDLHMYAAVPNLAIQQTDPMRAGERTSGAENYRSKAPEGLDFSAYQEW